MELRTRWSCDSSEAGTESRVTISSSLKRSKIRLIPRDPNSGKLNIIVVHWVGLNGFYASLRPKSQKRLEIVPPIPTEHNLSFFKMWKSKQFFNKLFLTSQKKIRIARERFFFFFNYFTFQKYWEFFEENNFFSSITSTTFTNFWGKKTMPNCLYHKFLFRMKKKAGRRRHAEGKTNNVI